jgi:hypothetical protein
MDELNGMWLAIIAFIIMGGIGSLYSECNKTKIELAKINIGKVNCDEPAK